MGDGDDVEPGIAACVQLGLGTPTSRLARHQAAAKLNVHAFGMNLHAATTVDGRDRKQLERLCRYMLRPPFAAGAIERLPDGGVRLDIVRQARSVTRTAEQFIAELIALVPPPGLHMIRYAGVFANRHHLRMAIAPEPCTPVVCEPSQIDIWTATGMLATVQGLGSPMPSRIAWARLLARGFQIDVLRCPRPGCNGRLRPTAAVLSCEEIALWLHGARGPPAAPVPGQLNFFN